MVVATATSLATIVPTSISSIRSHHKGECGFHAIEALGCFILVGVLWEGW